LSGINRGMRKQHSADVGKESACYRGLSFQVPLDIFTVMVVEKLRAQIEYPLAVHHFVFLPLVLGGAWQRLRNAHDQA